MLNGTFDAQLIPDVKTIDTRKALPINDNHPPPPADKESV